jgi:hypothetical protein
LLFTEIALTDSHEILLGFPGRLRKSIAAHPMRWAAALMAMFGLMQFVNSPSVMSSVLSGAGNGVVIGGAVLWWRRSGGAEYFLRELLPGSKGLKIFGGVPADLPHGIGSFAPGGFGNFGRCHSPTPDVDLPGRINMLNR